LDLESRLSLAKHQAQMAMDKASKSCSFMKYISILEDKVSGLTARVVHLEEYDSFLVGIVESTCEVLQCKVSCNFPLFSFLLQYYWPMTFIVVGTCWTSLVKFAVFLNGSRLLRDHQRESKVFSLIPGTIVLLCFSRIVLSTLEKQLMVVEDL
jgi:hypothetical protein